MASPHLDFLRSLQAVLSYHRTIGVDRYPAVQGLADFLKTAFVPGAAVSVSPGGASEKKDAVEGSSPAVSRGTARGIAGEVCSCTGCVLHTKRLSPLPGQGGGKPRLFIVGSWLTGEEGGKIPPGCILGLREDEMVARMLAAIRLSPEKAFVTNIIKCALPDSCLPSAENIQVCSNYLVRQIIVLSPEVICTMGLAATRALLKGTQPLSQIRGKIYPFPVTEQLSIPLVPTYHPTFLLQNPDFKRATWEDLQSIGRLLQGNKL